MTRFLSQLLLGAVLFTACSEKKATGDATSAATADSAITTKTTKEMQAVPGIEPVDMPDPHIPGYAFPDSANLTKWVNQADSLNLYRHGWGVWTALTMQTGLVYNGDSLRTYQTWHTPQELLALMAQPPAKALLTARPPTRMRLLARPHQFDHDPRRRAQGKRVMLRQTPDGINPIAVTVSYSPSAATTIMQQRLFSTRVLDSLQQAGLRDLTFRDRAVALKPVYEVVPGPQRSKGLYPMRVWAGTPSQSPPDSTGYDQDKWPATVFVDIRNGAHGNGSVGKPGAAPSAATTYNLRDFVYYTLTAAEADSLNADNSGDPSWVKANPGDYAILVAMHISTKEITDWTWQTMWWTPNPDASLLPSTPGILKTRPAQLTGAPRHYAMALADQMLTPLQPRATGQTYRGQPVYAGKSMYAFNPYLEAGFSTNTFAGKPTAVLTGGKLVYNNVGIRTNCMSCHAQATSAGDLPYVGNAFIDVNPASPAYKQNFGTRLRTDFLWSIPGNAH